MSFCAAPSWVVARVSSRSTTGIGALASRLVGGERTTHTQFEAEIAKFIGMDAADCFEAPPWGDCDLVAAKAALKGRVCLVGNLDDAGAGGAIVAGSDEATAGMLLK